MKDQPTPANDRLNELRTEYANTGMVTSGGAVWLISQVVVLREHVEQLRADQAAVLERHRAAVRRLAAHAAGFGDVLDASDCGPWERTVGADIAALCELLDAPATPLHGPAATRSAALTEPERKMLAYALDQAQEHICSRDGFTDDDQEAVISLRRLVDEAQS